MKGKSRIQMTMPAYAICACLALSCSKTELPPVPDGRENGISFAVTGENSPLTRGIPASSDNIAALFDNDVRIVAFRGIDEYITPQLLLSPSAENSSWHTSHSYFWPSSGNLDFWSWAPESLDAVFDENRSALSFYYSLPAPDPDTRQDAVTQKDIILAHIRADRDSYNGGVPLTFIHPLASIAFRGGTMRNGIVRSISLRSVAGSGGCIFDGNGFTWSPDGSMQTFTQIFDVSVNASESGQPITMAGSGTGERTFLMIPQTLGAEATLDVVFDDGAEVRTYSHSLAGAVWKAGTKHVYTISLSSDPDKEISVEETFDGFTKTNVSISNSGTSNVYLRAMIEANWVDADGCIVAPCDIFREGSFSGFNVSSTGGQWTHYSDGFYYYKKAVRPGHRTVELFTSYTPGPAPVIGSHLEMTIATQAVEYDVNQKGAKEAWGYGIPITGAVE